MLSKRQLLEMLVGLKTVNDLCVLDNPLMLNREVCTPNDVHLVRRMAAIIAELIDIFDYTNSPSFLHSIEGKSAQVRAMRLKLITPARQTEMRSRLGDALVKVMDSDEVFELVKSDMHERIKELRKLLSEVSNLGESIAT